MKKRKGFSLIEVMSVVAIIAILSAIAIPHYMKSRCKGQWGEVPSCLSDLSIKYENYRTNHGSYPVSTNGSIPAVFQMNSDKCGDFYQIEVWSDNDEYFIQASDKQKKLPCSSSAGDDEWVLTNTSPKVLHTKNSVEPGKVDPTPDRPS